MLVDFLSGLTEEQLKFSVPGAYGNSIDTVRHLICGDADYVRIIPDAPRIPQCELDGPFEGWDGLRRVADAAGTALITYAGSLTDDMLFIDVDDGEEFTLTRSILLAQIIHHATEHRSQIRTTLSAHRLDPPEISVWAWRKTEEGQALLSRLAGP